MKSILIGSVGSSKIVLEEMIKADFPLDMVFSLDERYSANVSGYYPLHELAEKNIIPFRKFHKINDEENVELIRKINPDYIFVIGLSQLVSKNIMEAAKIGVIGFHPTPLPKFRGRAAIVWQILLGVTETKCSLFFIDEGIDSGDIIAQEPYAIEDKDYASDVLNKCHVALSDLLKIELPKIKEGKYSRAVQKDEDASYLLKRGPEDGAIDWTQPAEKVQRLIRAVSKPYPGAYSYYNNEVKTIFWEADYISSKRYIGLPGQIANIELDYIDIICVDGLLRLYIYETYKGIKFVVGNKFK